MKRITLTPEMKKRLKKLEDRAVNIAFWCCMAWLGWMSLLVTTFASFKIPSDSMTPTLLPGDNIVVNKWIMGARIFDPWAVAAGEDVEIRRLPGVGKVKRNDVLVFNYPYPDRRDSIGMDVMLYYVKRCLALPGDTFRIERGRCRVAGSDRAVGYVDGQRKLQRAFVESDGKPKNLAVNAHPHDSLLGWTVRDMGPLYVPKRGATVAMNRTNALLYRRLIEWEQKGKLTLAGDTVLLSDSLIGEYRFRNNYYFMAGEML